jgi:hypothetical protein
VDVIGWIGAGTTIVSLAAGYFRPSDLRKPIERDAALIEKLPESSARMRLVEHIEKRVGDLVDREQHHTRDWSGVSAGVFLLGIAFTVFAFAVAIDTSWLRYLLTVLGSFVALLGAYGLGESLQLKAREPRPPRKAKPQP